MLKKILKDEKSYTKNVRIDEKTHLDTKIACAEAGIRIDVFVDFVVSEYLEKTSIEEIKENNYIVKDQ